MLHNMLRAAAGNRGGILSPNDPDLSVYYTMDSISGSTLIDSSPNGNDATITGATSVTGVVGDALSFDGTDDKAVWTNTETQNLSTGAFSFWVNISSVVNRTLYSKDTGVLSNIARMVITVRDVSGALRLDFDVSKNSGSTLHRARSSGSVSTGSFVHIVVTQDGTGLKFYINNVEQTVSIEANQTGTATLSNFWTSLAGIDMPANRIAHFYSVSIEGFSEIDKDQFREFSRGITASEVNDLYNEGA